ncbi:MAG: hypothetical protein ACYDG5_09355, partial [Dehalococcoidales bacterium]
MKISQSKVRVESSKAVPPVDDAKSRTNPKANVAKSAKPGTASRDIITVKKAPTAKTGAEGFLSYNETNVALHRVLASAQEELNLIRRMKAETAKYQQQSATKARSEAHQLILNARLTTHREIEEIIRQASEEIQKDQLM